MLPIRTLVPAKQLAGTSSSRAAWTRTHEVGVVQEEQRRKAAGSDPRRDDLQGESFLIDKALSKMYVNMLYTSLTPG